MTAGAGERTLRAVVRLACQAPRWTVFVALLLACAAATLAILRLEMRSSRLDLLSPQREYNQRWLAYLAEFGGDDDVVFVCQGPSESLEAVAARIAERVAAEPNLGEPLWKIDPAEWMGPQALSLRQLESIDSWLNRFDPGDLRAWAGLTAHAQLADVALQNSRPLSSRTNALALNLARALQSPRDAISPVDLGLGGQTSQLLANEAGTQTLVLVPIRRDGNGGFEGGAATFARLRKIARETMTEFSSKPIEVGVTGMPVLEFDEMASSQRDSLRASIVSFALVSVLFIVAFGQVRLPMTAVSCLALGVAWTLGFVTLTVGHLNLLSVAFGAILVGLGIDFTIHLAASFQSERSNGKTTQAAIEAAAGRTGVGILTGGLTSAIAFITASWTPFRGVAELGWITSGGLLLCLAATLIVFPALLCCLFGTKSADNSVSSSRSERPELRYRVLPLGTFVSVVTHNPRAVIALSCALTAVAAYHAGKIHYDHNLLNLQPAGIDSVRWERELIHRSDRSVWFAVSVADSTEQALRRKQQFLDLDMVASVEELTSPFVVTDQQRQQIKAVRAKLQRLPVEPVRVTLPPLENWQRLQQVVNVLVERNPVGPMARSLQTLQATMTRLESSGPARLAAVEAAWRERLWEELHQTRELLARPLASPKQLPDELYHRFYGKQGGQVLRVYPAGDIWDFDRLQQFVAAVESVDRRVTGHPVQTYYASREMQQSYIHAGIYAAIAVVMVLYIDLKSFGSCLLAMAPMLFGIVQTFGILAACEIPLNAANMIVIPLIIGIGIDDGIHVVHDFQRRRPQQQKYRMSDATATAITITSATTMAGFGSMMLADHQGLRSLGQVLTLGIFCCWFTSLVVLPALLSLWGDRRR